MIALLVILFIIKLYARNNTFKSHNILSFFQVILYMSSYEMQIEGDSTINLYVKGTYAFEKLISKL